MTRVAPGATPAGRRHAGSGRAVPTPRGAGASSGAGAGWGGWLTSGRTRTAPSATGAAGASRAGGDGRLPARETPRRSIVSVISSFGLLLGGPGVEVDGGARDDAVGVRLERHGVPHV